MELDPLSALFARDEEEAARHIPREFLDAAAIAMRFALTNDGAPARCRRKICHRQGGCHFVIDAAGDGVCSGGISQAAIDQAALMLAFLNALGRAKVGKGAGFADLELDGEMRQMAAARKPSLEASARRRRKGRPKE